jgi:hypothetical protein
MKAPYRVLFSNDTTIIVGIANRDNGCCRR